MAKSKSYDEYTKKALETLSEIIEEAEDLKVKISAIKEILNITVSKSKADVTAPTVIIKGDVEN